MRAKLPDTYYTVPAFVIRNGRRVQGYLTLDTGVYTFHTRDIA